MQHDPVAHPEEGGGEINLTPMLDVVFIMLIFFIVAASFIKEAGIDVNRPERDRSAPPTNDGILVTIAADNGIWLDGRLIDPRAVRANLERRRAETPGAPVVVRVHARSVTDTLVRVMDASRAAGMYDIAIAADGMP